MSETSSPSAEVDDGPSSLHDDVLVDAVIAALPSGVLMIDREGRIGHANPSAAEILGRAREELLGQKLSEVRGELDAMIWPADKGELLLLPEGAAPQQPAFRARVLGFSSRPLVGPEGRREGTVISFSDITRSKERSQHEAHRRRLADLGTVVATIAHEIRNPVFAIASVAQVMLGEPIVKSDPDVALMARKVLDEARRIGRMVDDLLAFGGNRPIACESVDVVLLLETLVPDLARGFAEAAAVALPVPIRLHVSPEMQKEREWNLDAEGFRRIVSNLVRNAWQAVEARSSERGPEAGVDLYIDRRGDALELRVEDQGVGIPEDRCDRVFDAFFTTRQGGTGLGLAIVRRLVKAHHGKIELSSALGRGTAIKVRIPP